MQSQRHSYAALLSTVFNNRPNHWQQTRPPRNIAGDRCHHHQVQAVDDRCQPRVKLSYQTLASHGHAAGDTSEKFFLSRKEPLRGSLFERAVPMNDYSISECIPVGKERLQQTPRSGRRCGEFGANFGGLGGVVRQGRSEQEFERQRQQFGNVRNVVGGSGGKHNTLVALVESLQNVANVTMGQQASQECEADMTFGKKALDRRELRTQRKLGLFGKENCLRTPQDRDHRSREQWETEMSGSASRSSAARSDGSTEETDEAISMDTDDTGNETDNHYAVGTSRTARSSVRSSTAETPLLYPSVKQIVNIPVTRQYGVNITRMRFGLDKRLTLIDEKSPAVLKYRTPHFRAMAVVDIPPLHDGESIQIGWIQVCTEMQFINVYGNEGLTSWEFPEIVSGKYKMISDADGKQYPWYGLKNEVKKLEGPLDSPTSVTVHMNDNFFPQVTWYIPHSDYPRHPKLTNIYRKQRFFVFLALRDLNTRNYHILRTITWSMELAIDVNPALPLGRRAKLIGPFEQDPPRVVEDNAATALLLEDNAMNPPNANNSQVLVWRPKIGPSSVIVAPIQTTMDINQYIQASADYTLRLRQLASRIFRPAA